MSFIEKTLTCSCCGTAFTFGTREQMILTDDIKSSGLARSADIRLTSKDKEL